MFPLPFRSHKNVSRRVTKDPSNGEKKINATIYLSKYAYETLAGDITPEQLLFYLHPKKGCPKRLKLKVT